MDCVRGGGVSMCVWGWWCMDVCVRVVVVDGCVCSWEGARRVYMCGYAQDVNSDNYSCAYSKSASV